MACRKALEVVEDVDVQRYAGVWYEIARLPNWFERNCTGDVSATYGVRADGTISVTNQCVKKQCGIEVANGVARLKEPNSKRGHWKVTFAPTYLRMLPFVWADYCVLYLDENYSLAVIGEPLRKYLWILARDRTIDDVQFEKMLQVAVKQGFDLSNLIRNV